LPNVPRKIFPLLVLLSPLPIPVSFPSKFWLYEKILSQKKFIIIKKLNPRKT
jgi:hypothetical protein